MKYIVLIATLLTAASALAEEGKDGVRPCRADAERLCKGVEVGKGRLAQCLKEHEAQVSGECRAHMEKTHQAMQARMEEFNEACKADVEQHCRDVAPGKGRVMGCLRKNEANLSAGCREQVAKMDAQRERAHQRMHAAAEACKDDARQYCADIKRGGGRMMRCLKDNEAKLSQNCRTALQPGM